MKAMLSILLLSCGLMLGSGDSDKGMATIAIDFPYLKFMPKNAYFMLKVSGEANAVYGVEYSFDLSSWVWLAYVRVNDNGVWVSSLLNRRGEKAFFRLQPEPKGGGGMNSTTNF